MTTMQSAPPTPDRDSKPAVAADPEMGSVSVAAQSRRRIGAGVVALGVLLLGFLTTGLVALLISGQVDSENAVRLERAEDSLAQDLDSRITIYSETLVGMQGLFASTDVVSRREFAQFTETADTFERFPGLQGLSFSPVVLRSDLERFEATVRDDTSLNGVGYPEFEVRTGGDAPDLFVVNYIVPLEGNEAAFGFDLGSNPARRAAIEEARDSGRIVATAPITLVQEEGEQAGVLLLAPAYDGAHTTEAERRESFIGVFSAVLRMGDFLDGTSGQSDLDFAVFDESPDQSESPDGRTVLYTTRSGRFIDAPAAFTIDVAGRTWGVVLDRDSVPAAGRSGTLILLGGLVAALPYALASYFSYRERDRLNTQAVALQMANDEIQTSNADLERFAYVAAHDLRSPIRGIRNVVDMLDDELEDDIRTTDVDDLLGHLDRSASKMDLMVQGLLEFATVGGDRTNTWTAVDTNTITHEAVETVRTENEIDIFVDVEQLHWAHGNPVLIERLFQNLIGNAVKYRDAERMPQIRIWSERIDDTVTFSISDNGIGIDPKYHDRVFEIFRRLHGPGEIDGRGLGLALCRKIVEHHDGHIWLSSKEGDGATFSFTLPCTPVR